MQRLKRVHARLRRAMAASQTPDPPTGRAPSHGPGSAAHRSALRSIRGTMPC